MKYLSLQQAMLGMRVVLTEAGVLLKSPAGSAEYSRKGPCIKVTGHADYFPNHLRVKDKRTAKDGRVSMTNNYMTAYKADGSVAWRIGAGPKEDSPCLSIEHGYTSDELREAVEYIKRKRKEKADAKAMAESSPFTVKDGQVFIKDAHIGNSVGSGWRITNVGVTINSHNFIPKKGINDNFQQGESRVKILAEKLAVAANTQNALETALQQSIKKVVDEVIQQAMRPGGVIWKAGSRGI